MVELRTDRELVRDYVENGSEGAFQELLARHLDLVFATALRGLNDTGAAQEVTQNVFIALARKAPWLGGETSLTGWLHKTALLEVRQWWRGECRRRRREQAAVELGTLMKEEDPQLKALAADLDEGLLELHAAERQALMLRYFEGRTHKEIGTLLGAREDAVRMRTGKALDRLTRFFRRRGYAVPNTMMTAGVLAAAAKAAPAGLVVTATRMALTAGGGGAACGLKLLLLRLMGLTKTQSTVLCAALALAPVTWQWHGLRAAQGRAARAAAALEATQGQEEQAAAELEGLQAESGRLANAWADAERERANAGTATSRLEDLRTRLRKLLADDDNRWHDDLPYVRVPKAVVKSLNPLDAWPGTFGPQGTLTPQAQELFGITAEEKTLVEQALGDYWRQTLDLMAANAYESNPPTAEPGRLTKAVVVPPLGQPLKTLAEQTSTQLRAILGAEREQLVFGDWAKGGIQIFWPGNIWLVGDTAQNFTAWLEPATDSKPARAGIGWHDAGGGGTSCDREGGQALEAFPRGIATRFFVPWLSQFGVTTPTRYFGDPNE